MSVFDKLGKLESVQKVDVSSLERSLDTLEDDEIIHPNPWKPLLKELKYASLNHPDLPCDEDLEEVILFLLRTLSMEKFSQLLLKFQNSMLATEFNTNEDTTKDDTYSEQNTGDDESNAWVDIARLQKLARNKSMKDLNSVSHYDRVNESKEHLQVEKTKVKAFSVDSRQLVMQDRTTSELEGTQNRRKRLTWHGSNQFNFKIRCKSADDKTNEIESPSVPTWNQVKRWQFSPDAPAGFSPKDAFNLLQKVFPVDVLEPLQWELGGQISQSHPSVSVFFSDIVGFTEWSSKVTADVVIGCLSSYFQILDDYAERCGVYKVETIGDGWMAVCGAPTENLNHASTMAKFALEVLTTLDDLKEIFDHPTMTMRIGIHCGPVVSGIVRADRPRWQLFGDTVNMASRMESTGVPGSVQISQNMFEALQNSVGHVSFLAEPRGKVQIKGKGMQETYLLKYVQFWEKKRRSSTSLKDRLTVFNPPEQKPRDRGGSVPDIKAIRGKLKSSLMASLATINKRIAEQFSGPKHTTLSEESDSKSRFYHMDVKAKRDSGVSLDSCDSGNYSLCEGGAADMAVLLVDDVVSVLMQYRRLIQKTGLAVFTARDGLEALSLMQKKSFVVVFMNPDLPNLSGCDCVAQFREWEQDNRVLKQYILALSKEEDVTYEENNRFSQIGFNGSESMMNSKAAILDCVTKRIADMAI